MPLYAEKPVIHTIEVTISSNSESLFAAWQAKLNAIITTFSGFVSLEFIHTNQESKEWLIIQRFTTPETATTWRNSTEYQQFTTQLKTFSEMHEVVSDELNNSVTQMIFTKVNPDKLELYQEWSSKMHAAEAKFPGFRGVYVQSPTQGNGEHWITLLQFDSMEHLDHWLGSEERQQLLNEASSYIDAFESHRVISPYAGWFTSIAKVSQVPPAWKQAMIVLLVLFPIVMVEFKYLSPLTRELDISLATFISNAISVGLLTYPMVPLAIKGLSWWLSPSPSCNKRNTLLGTVFVLMLYLLEISIFWNFI